MAKKKEETVEEQTDAVVEEASEEKTEKKTEKTSEAKSSKKKEEKVETEDASLAESAVDDVAASDEESTKKTRRKRSEKVGIVFSDKMTNTVVVRVNRMVKHQLYHKYMKKRKKFMAHDELGASVGDRVRIVETRPLSAKKRWRVVEIIQKAEK